MWFSTAGYVCSTQTRVIFNPAVGFILESTRNGHLIPGVVVFSIRSFFPLENPCSLLLIPQTIDAGLLACLH